MDPQTNRNSNSNASKKVLEYAPVDYGDVNDIPPDAAPGEYVAKITKVRAGKTSKESIPMLMVDWTIKEAAEADNEQFIGAEVTDFLTFYPADNRKGKMGKIKLRSLLELLGVDSACVPQQIKTSADFDDLVENLMGQEATIFVSHRDVDGEQRCNVNYTAPKGLGSLGDGDDGGEVEEKPAARKPAGKPAAKPNKRR